MRTGDMVAMEAGRQTAASVAAGADSRAAEEPDEPITSGGTLFGSVRERRPLWAILSILFFLGFVVSTLVVHSERNRALDGVAKLARDDAQLLTATLTGKQFTKPVMGSSYDEFAKKTGKTLTKGSIVGVTVWSSQGQILFSLNESLVGTTPPEMQPLIVGIAQGSGGTRVLDDTVQTFLPVSKTPGARVAVVELDQPYAFVEARIGSFWSIVRMAFAFGLVISLLLLGLAFISSRRLARVAEDAERLPKGDGEADMEAEGRPEEQLTEDLAPTVSEDLQVPPVREDLEVLQPDLDEAVDQDADQDKDLPADIELQELVRRREEFKARASEAKRRVKKLGTQLQEAPSAPKSDR